MTEDGKGVNVMDTPITRAEHEEFRRRLEESNARQDKRISLVEESVKRIDAMTTSIEKLALNMENMLKEQLSQGKRLETLEGRDGEMWRKVVGYVITTFLGVLVGFICTRFGM